MKKFFLILFLILAGSFVIFQIAEAQAYTAELAKQMQAVAGSQGANFGTPNDPRFVIIYIIQILLGLLGLIMTAYVVYAGFLIMTAGGEEEKTKKGKSIISYGIIGLAVILSSFGILVLVSSFMNVAQQCTGVLCSESSVEVLPGENNFNADPYSKRVPGGLPSSGGTLYQGGSGYTPPSW